jgi:hypothetical protein
VDISESESAGSGAPFEARRVLPSGGWVELRDPALLKKRDRDAALKGVTSQTVGAAGVELTNQLILAMVLDWKVPYLPDAVAPHRNPKLVGELSIRDAVALEKIAKEYQDELFPEEPSIDQAGTPGSPTPPGSE